MKNRVQKFGKFLSAMVMPNIGALIAFGFLAALFIDTGWIPNKGFNSMVGPMLTYLIPILIASTGGRMAGGDRGRVVGAIAVIGPAMSGILAVMSVGVNALVQNELLPLVAVFFLPAKVLFLNNAINHGIFTPLATAQAAETGKSIMYMLEPNPGPGLGVLLAYMFFCKDKATKDSAPGAVIIHLLGGIHEIYFPYILMNPLVIIAPIAGNIAAIFWFNMMRCGLVGPASPGSVIAYMMMAPGPDMLKVLIGIVISAGISFAIASILVKMAGERSLEDAQKEMAAMKAQAKGLAVVPGTIEKSTEIKKIVFACDAGMGSSAMGATKFRNRIKAGRPDITVTNTSVDNIPADCDIAVVQTTLAERARKSAPQAQLITIGNFLADPALDALYIQLSTGDAPAAPAGENTDIVIPDVPIKRQVIIREGIHLHQKPVTKEEAIQAAGEMLVKLGYVDETYIDAMQERERLVSTYIGMGVAIPHGTTQAKGTVKKTGIVCFQYPEGVDFGTEKAQLVFGIAGIGDEHLDLLSKLCTLLEDEALLETLKTTEDVSWVLEQLS